MVGEKSVKHKPPVKLSFKTEGLKSLIKLFYVIIAAAFIAAPSLSEGAVAHKGINQREAKIRAISDTLKYYNNTLSNAKTREYATLITDIASKRGENPFAIGALIIAESTGRTNAYSKGNYGLLQVKWRVHKKMLKKKFPTIKTEKDLFKPRENILAGTEIFARVRNGGDIQSGLRKYMGGSSSLEKVKRYLSEIEDRYKKYMKK